MATRAQPPVRTFVDGERFDDQDAIDKLNENNQMIQVKFGCLTYDDFNTSVQTTLTWNGSIDVRGHLLSNVSSAMKVFNVLEDTRNLPAIMTDETNPVIFIPANTTVTMATMVPLKDNCQIIGAGPSSVIRNVLTNAITLFEAPAGVQNWSIRNLSLQGRRGTDAVDGIRVFNARSTHGEVENVAMGPLPGESTATALNRPVVIEGGSGVRFTNCQIRASLLTGMFMQDTNFANSKVEDVEIFECTISECAERGIEVNGASNIMIRKNFIGNNGEENIRIFTGSYVVIADNDIYDGSTASAGTDRSLVVQGSGTTDVNGVIIMGNRFVDRPLKTLERHVSLGANVSRCVLMNNVFNMTTNDGGHVFNNSTVISQQGNLMHEGGYGFESNREIAALNGTTRWQTWKMMKYAESGEIPSTHGPYGNVEQISEYQRSYVGEFCHPFDDMITKASESELFNFRGQLLLPHTPEVQECVDNFVIDWHVENPCVEYEIPWNIGGQNIVHKHPPSDTVKAGPCEDPPIPIHCYMQFGDASEVKGIVGGFVEPVGAATTERIGTSDVIRKFGNLGATLTPERYHAQTSHLSTFTGGAGSRGEVRAIIATYNLAPAHEGDNITSTPMVPGPGRTQNALFPAVASAAAVTGMDDNVLVAHITGTVNDEIDIISAGYRVASFDVGTTVVVGKPTWVSVKV
jgi:hypothetical protein